LSLDAEGVCGCNIEVVGHLPSHPEGMEKSKNNNNQLGLCIGFPDVDAWCKNSKVITINSMDTPERGNAWTHGDSRAAAGYFCLLIFSQCGTNSCCSLWLVMFFLINNQPVCLLGCHYGFYFVFSFTQGLQH